MQHAVLNRATIQVADTTEVCGRITAKSVQHAKKQSSLGRIWGLTIFSSVAWVAVLAPFAPMPAQAQGVPAEIAALKAQVAALQSQVQALQSQLAKVEHNKALLLGPFVDVNPNPENGVRGPNIKFCGANIHIVSGSGATDDKLSNGGSLTGLGNLIIGYDELLTGEPVNRGGSHNLVIGRFNTFTSSAFGGLVAGEENTISDRAASVSGGVRNTASGFACSVSGGRSNTATASPLAFGRPTASSVSGGASNTASGIACSVSGGDSNTATGTPPAPGVATAASVSGGQGNTASGLFASISGGRSNSAFGFDASISGGRSNSADAGHASILGGVGNRVVGEGATILGGQGNFVFIINSIRPQPPFSP